MGWKAEPGTRVCTQTYDKPTTERCRWRSSRTMMAISRRHSLTSNVHISSVNHSPSPMQSTLVDAEGRLGTPGLHRDYRPGCQDSRGIDLLTNLGAGWEYRRGACTSLYIHAHPGRVSVLVEET